MKNLPKSEIGTPLVICADDNVISWTRAWYASIRAVNNSIPIVLIPFSANIIETVNLMSGDVNCYSFGREQHPSIFSDIDRIVSTIWHKPKSTYFGCFYRFASFFLPTDGFFYSDVDMVYYCDPSVFIEHPIRSSFELCYCSEAPGQSYKPEMVQHMRREFRSKEVSSEIILARTHLRPMDQILKLAKPIDGSDNPHADWLRDQPFLNMMIDYLGVKSVSIKSFSPHFAKSTWPNRFKARKLTHRDGLLPVWDAPDEPLNHSMEVPLLHWAGYNLSRMMPLWNEFARFRYQPNERLERYRFETRSFASDCPGYVRNRVREWAGAGRQNLRQRFA